MTREYEGLKFEQQGSVATITLNRPERLNAILFSMIEGITEIVDECGRDESVRAIVITGEGRAFSSGDDIVGGMGDLPARWERPGLHANLGPHHLMTKMLMSCPKPVMPRSMGAATAQAG